MRHIFIINPIAGDGKYQKEIANNIHNLCKDKHEYEIYYSKSQGDAALFVKNKSQDLIPTVFYACGGDGTLHEVINAAINYDHVHIGIIPCGSGNDFIKNFDNYGAFNDLTSQIKGKSIELDLIKVNNVYAATVLNVGLDADVAFNMHKFKKVPFIQGSTRYYLAILYSLFSKLGKSIEVIMENKVIKDSFLIGVIANGQYYGSGYNCAPKADISDGILDLCFVKNISRTKILSLLGSYKKGKHLEDPKINKFITYIKIKQAIIKFDETTNVCMDGEKYTYNEINISTEEAALRFWLPNGVQVKSEKAETVLFD